MVWMMLFIYTSNMNEIYLRLLALVAPNKAKCLRFERWLHQENIKTMHEIIDYKSRSWLGK